MQTWFARINIRISQSNSWCCHAFLSPCRPLSTPCRPPKHPAVLSQHPLGPPPPTDTSSPLSAPCRATPYFQNPAVLSQHPAGPPPTSKTLQAPSNTMQSPSDTIQSSSNTLQLTWTFLIAMVAFKPFISTRILGTSRTSSISTLNKTKKKSRLL